MQPNVSNDSEQLLKFHGVYSQDNRDVRRERAQAGEPLDYIFMIRVVIPGGRLSSEQWLGLDEIAGSIADGSIRLTTRQAVQYHGVVKGDLRELARSLDRQFLSSFGACGDVVRNVVTCPNLHLENGHGHLEGIAPTATPELSLDVRSALGDLRERREGRFARRDRRASLLRRDVPAAQVQDRRRAPARQLRRRLRPRSRPHPGRARRARRGLHAARRRRARALLREPRHLRPSRRAAHLRHQRRGRRGHCGRSSKRTETSATARIASARA